MGNRDPNQVDQALIATRARIIELITEAVSSGVAIAKSEGRSRIVGITNGALAEVDCFGKDVGSSKKFTDDARETVRSCICDAVGAGVVAAHGELGTFEGDIWKRVSSALDWMRMSSALEDLKAQD
ncbi:MAG: hypothetical protein KTV68_13465 [Acidimicrobiia bacterium]|nr:hypothetical protein [Acidimicrobiia bacterium]MCY4434131.1 hypothetical protein [bacterium]